MSPNERWKDLLQRIDQQVEQATSAAIGMIRRPRHERCSSSFKEIDHDELVGKIVVRRRTA